MATDDFATRLQTFYDGCSPDEQRLVALMCTLTLDATGHLGDVEGFGMDSLDSLSEMGETQQLRMQMYMDRVTKADSARSNAMKKFGDVSAQIVGNLK